MKFVNPIEYFIDEEKGVVIAKLNNIVEDCSYSIMNLMKKACDKNLPKITSGFIKLILGDVPDLKFIKKNHIPMTLYGKARCNFLAGDVFDEEYGRQLATQRLLVKLYNLRARLLYAIMIEWYDITNELENSYEDILFTLSVKEAEFNPVLEE